MKSIILGVVAALAATLFAGCTSLHEDPTDTLVTQSPPYQETAIVPIQRLTGELTLDMALAAAHSANPTLSVGKLKIKVAEAAIRQAGVLPNPEISSELEEFGGSGDQSGTDAMQSTIEISQEIQLGGKRKRRVQLAQQELRITKIELEEVRLALNARVRLAFLDAQTAQKEIELARTGLGIVRKSYDVVMKRVKSGDLSPIQINKARVALASGKVAVLRSERQLSIARKELVSLWGSRKALFSKVIDVPEAHPVIPDDSLLNGLLGKHPSALKLQAEVARAKTAVFLAEAEAWPDMEVSAGASRSNETDDSAFLLGFSIPLPLFNRNKGRIDEANAQVGQAESTRTLGLLEMRRDFSVLKEKLSASESELKAFREEIVPAAGQAHEAVLKAFETGALGFLDVLDAQRTLLEAKQAELGLTAEFQKLAIELDRITGKSLKSSEK